MRSIYKVDSAIGAVLIGLASLVGLPSALATEDGQPPAGQRTITLPLTAESMTRLPSPWAEYFGTHYASSPEGAGR